jgi:transcriptional regulator with XRE-family HTH domain
MRHYAGKVAASPDSHPLKVVRTRANITQRELSRAADVNLKTIKGIESRRTRNPKAATLRQLARVLRVTPQSLEDSQ